MLRSSLGFSRRGVFGAFGALASAAAAGPAPAATPTLAAVPPAGPPATPADYIKEIRAMGWRAVAMPTGPLTPAEFLAEMQAIGWSAVAMLSPRGEPVHVIERAPDDLERRCTPENMFAFMCIQRRVSESGADFWKRTSAYLFSLGLREDLHKAVRS